MQAIPETTVMGLLQYLHSRYQRAWGLSDTPWKTPEEFSLSAVEHSRAVDIAYSPEFNTFGIRVIRLDAEAPVLEDSFGAVLPVATPVFGMMFTEKQLWFTESRQFTEVVFVRPPGMMVHIPQKMLDEIFADGYVSALSDEQARRMRGQNNEPV
jgi:hypothetical protein